MSQSYISEELYQLVAEHSRYRCGYCLTQEAIVGERFPIEHIMPEALGGTTTPDNLCLACWSCNLIKQKRIASQDPKTGLLTRFFQPNQQKWNDHFLWEEEGLFISGKTAVGRTTVQALKLNRPRLVNARRLWIKAGWHPPKD